MSHCAVQWGSEIMTSVDFEWSKKGWVTIRPDFKWDLKSRSQQLEIQTNGYHFVKNPLKSGLKYLDFEW